MILWVNIHYKNEPLFFTISHTFWIDGAHLLDYSKCMKTRDLKKKLKALGASFLREGGSHEIWISKKGLILVIPRHKETKEHTARNLIKDAREN